jgi:D-beta-D-heptose 7-phosphate kinase/D-beta-D-heptose 1-phosphate adenosyltransferase
MDTSIRDSISSAVAYYQVFKYYLTLHELHEYLHSENAIDKNDLTADLENSRRLVNDFVISNAEWCKRTVRRVRARHKQIKKQQIKLRESLKKMAIAKKITQILQHIPSIELIAVSGNLAMMNAREQDDIDLFIVTRSNTAWTTRFLASAMLFILNKKRMYGARLVQNKICLNLFIDENHLEMKKKNLYVAHEIAQMKVLYAKHDIYQKFLAANSWVKSHLFNWWQMNFHGSAQESLFEELEETGLINKLVFMLFQFLEPALRFLQLQYMRHRVTREVIREGVLMFHPRDYGKEVMRKYRLQLLK